MLLTAVLVLEITGLLILYSASAYNGQVRFADEGYYLKKQLFAAVLGMAAMTMISRIDYHRIARFAPAAYIGSWILSGAVLLVGDAYNGSRRWLSIGPLSFQPSEFAKPAVILFLSHLISKKEKVGNGLGSLIGCIVLVLPIVALVGTNNLSTAIIILGIAVILAFVSRPGYAQFLWIGLAGTGVVTIFLMMEQYRLERLAIWKNPEAHEKDPGTLCHRIRRAVWSRIRKWSSEAGVCTRSTE